MKIKIKNATFAWSLLVTMLLMTSCQKDELYPSVLENFTFGCSDITGVRSYFEGTLADRDFCIGDGVDGFRISMLGGNQYFTKGNTTTPTDGFNPNAKAFLSFIAFNRKPERGIESFDVLSPFVPYRDDIYKTMINTQLDPGIKPIRIVNYLDSIRAGFHVVYSKTTQIDPVNDVWDNIYLTSNTLHPKEEYNHTLQISQMQRDTFANIVNAVIIFDMDVQMFVTTDHINPKGKYFGNLIGTYRVEFSYDL